MGSQNRQAGMALLIFLVLLLAGASAFAISVQGRDRHNAQSDADRYRQLREAKRLLIGAVYNSNNRPGEMRPADADGDGDGDIASTSQGTQGHLPWRQLQATRGMHKGHDDDSSETLWYFVSENFLDDSGNYLNYDTETSLTIDGVGGYAAVIVSPGDPISDAQSALRPSHSLAHIPAYLEEENAVDDDQFISHVDDPDVLFNDLVTGIHKGPLLDIAAEFATRKFVRRLKKYALGPAGCENQYPVPAPFDSDLADDPNANPEDLHSDTSLPEIIVGMPAVSSTGVLPFDWETCEEKLNRAVDSFLEQRWFRFMRYARAEGGIGCVPGTPGADCLVVQSGGGVLYDDVEALVITSGIPLSGQSWSGSPQVTDYFEGENANDDNIFVQGDSTSTFNDRLYIVSRSGL